MLTGSFTDRGYYRERNEDAVKCTVSGDKAFLVIADGLGGMPFGQVASRIACNEATDILVSGWEDVLDGDGRREFLLRLFNEVNGKILRRCIDDPDLSGMCTTLTVVVLTSDLCVTGHVGDSRAYLVKEDGIVRITKDHNRAARLVEEGKITEEEALRHAGRNMLTQVVGENTFLDPYIREDKVSSGDCVVLVTDGVYSVLEEEDMAGIRDRKEDPEGFCKDLVTKAVTGGSFDNCTAAVGIAGGDSEQ